MKINDAIIIGGGASIRQDKWDVPIKDLSIWKQIKNKFTIGTNYSFKWFTPTVLMYNDYQFYASEKENLKDVPLILGRDDGVYKRKNGIKTSDNVILLKECKRQSYIKWNEIHAGMHPYYWGKDAWTQGFYCSQLIGLKALNLAIAMGCKRIFLLGLDATAINGHTHFYDDTSVGSYEWCGQKYSGVGFNSDGTYKTKNYNQIDELNNCWYKPFEKEFIENNIQIYNVSPFSKIELFPKIDYTMLLNFLKLTNNVSHEEIRNKIKEKLK